MNSNISVPAGVSLRPFGGGAAIRLRFRGWIVDVDAAGAVTIPRQQVPGDVNDLAVCIEAARTVATARRDEAKQAHIKPAPPAQRPETVPDRQAPIPPLMRVLSAARDIAADGWHPSRNDIYACTKKAWIADEMRVPHAWLLRALRAVLPADTTLSDVNDTADRAAVIHLYTDAMRALQARGAPVRAAS